MYIQVDNRDIVVVGTCRCLISAAALFQQHVVVAVVQRLSYRSSLQSGTSCSGEEEQRYSQVVEEV